MDWLRNTHVKFVEKNFTLNGGWKSIFRFIQKSTVCVFIITSTMGKNAHSIKFDASLSMRNQGLVMRRFALEKCVRFGHEQVEIEVVTENLEDSVHGSTTEMEDEVGCPQCGCTFVDDVELDWHMKANHMSRQNLNQANGM